MEWNRASFNRMPAIDDTPTCLGGNRVSPHVGVTIPFATQTLQGSPKCHQQEMENLVDMQNRRGDSEEAKRKKQIALEALNEWKETLIRLEVKEDRESKNTERLTYEVYQLVGLYSVFMGVVFTAVLQSDRVTCRNLWSPVFLCLFAWIVINVVTKKRFQEISLARKSKEVIKNKRKKLKEKLKRLREIGYEKFDFTKLQSEDSREAGNSEEQTWGWKHFGSSKTVCLTRIMLTLLTVVLLTSFIDILCLNKLLPKNENLPRPPSP